VKNKQLYYCRRCKKIGNVEDFFWNKNYQNILGHKCEDLHGNGWDVVCKIGERERLVKPKILTKRNDSVT